LTNNLISVGALCAAMLMNAKCRGRKLQETSVSGAAVLLACAVAVVCCLAASRADANIYQWTTSGGSVVQSTTLCVGGSGVSAVANANLSNLNLTQAYLIGANVSVGTLTNTNLTNANLTNASFTAATLPGAILTNAIVSGADFSNTTSLNAYSGSGFTSAQLYSTLSYSQSNLQGVKLADNILTNWSFAGQNLAGASFSYSMLANANFTGANLTGANLASSTLTGATFTGATIAGTILDQATGFTSAQLYSTLSYAQSNLQGIQFQNNDMTSWNLAGQNLSGTQFNNCSNLTNLAGANLANTLFLSMTLSGANLAGANLTNADAVFIPLTNANLSGANLTGFSASLDNFSGASLSGATIAKMQFSSATNFTQSQLYSTWSYSQSNLQGVGFGSDNVAGWNFNGQNLTGAAFASSTLTNATFSGAIVGSANFSNAASAGFTQSQLVSTLSYSQSNLQGIDLGGNNLSGWNFAGQNLTGGSLGSCWVTGATFTGATVAGVDFSYPPSGGGLTSTQLYSTLSYSKSDLHGIGLAGNNMAGWNFAGQNLTGADLSSGTLAGATFTGALVTGANFSNYSSTASNNLTLPQLYSTTSYSQSNLQAVSLAGLNMAGGNFADQNLAGASFNGTTVASATFTNAIVIGADFSQTTAFFASSGTGFTASQLYSTLSYSQSNLQGMGLSYNNLTGWNFAGQNLAGANFGSDNLSNASFANANLANAYLVGTVFWAGGGTLANFTNVNFANADLANTSFYEDVLSGVNMNGADMRGMRNLPTSGFTSTNAISTSGVIAGLNLSATHPLEIVRSYSGTSSIPIQITGGMNVPGGTTLQMVFSGANWGSTISFAYGTSASLGGNLELSALPGTNPASFVGTDFQLFNWTGATRSGQFTIVNDLAASGYQWDTSALYTTGNVILENLTNGVWAANGGGTWSGTANWSGGNVPGILQDTAVFGTALSGGTATVTLDASRSLSSIGFSTTAGASYAIGPSGTNTLTLSNPTGSATISNSGGNHTIAVPIILGSNLSVNASAGSTLTIAAAITENNSGTSLSLGGAGELILSGTSTYSGGTIVNSGTLAVTTANALPSAGVLVVGRSGRVVLGNTFAIPTSPVINGQWASDGSGTWSGTANWTNGNVPGAPQDTAIFGTVLTSGTATVTLDGSRSLCSLGFNTTGANSYIISPSNGSTLTLANTATGTAMIGNSGGNNTIAAPIALGNNLSVTASTDSVLTIAGAITENNSGTSLSVVGGGELILNGADTYSGGTIVNGGTLAVGSASALPNAGVLVVGRSGCVVLGDSLGAAAVVASSSLTGDESTSLTAVPAVSSIDSSAAGQASVPAVQASVPTAALQSGSPAAVPEPSTLALIVVGALALIGWRRRRAK
jgi:autotransporter-associated beta strand protein